jgi:hypothetical protein
MKILLFIFLLFSFYLTVSAKPKIDGFSRGEMMVALVKKLHVEAWMVMLHSDSTDWAASLVLHHLYDKDAFQLAKNDGLDFWVKYLKNDDLIYWDNKFKEEGH